ncbi:MAG: hypothetical protein ACREH4_11305 [Vitreimonas sp.]
MPLQLLAISGRRVFRTTRHDETSPWAPWQDLNIAVGPLAAPARVGCATVSGALHVCVLETNALRHTVETSPDAFTGWDAAHVAAFPGITMGQSVDCAGIGGQLHLCLDGFRISGDIMTFPSVLRSIRNAQGAWSPPREVMQRSPVIRDIACASRLAASGRQQLEVFARSQVQTGAGASRTTIEALVHTTLLPTGAASRDVNMTPALPPAAATANVPGVRSIAAAGIRAQLHVVLAQEGELFHTVSGTGASGAYGSVRTLVGDTSFGESPLTMPACANSGGNLHVCAVSGARIVHTIRLADGLWRNPESNAAGVWSDVTAALGPLPGPIADIACAGD